MTLHFSRRRFLAVSACALAAPASAAGETASWRGRALGAGAAIRLHGVNAAQVGSVFSQVEAELARLEAIFSLFKPGSAIATLNRDGRLRAPPPELLEVLSLCSHLNAGTGGTFDPSVQVLWTTHAEAAFSGSAPDPDRLDAARDRTGWHHLHFDTGLVEFARPGMALTLNGIAQGYITDRIATLLVRRNFGNILVDMGEIAARGTRGDGAAWEAGIAAPSGRIVNRITLSNRALATSAPAGTVLDPEGRVGHIIDPVSGLPAMELEVVSVSAETAALADGLSTACCLIPPAAVPEVVARFGGARLEGLQTARRRAGFRG